MIDRTATPNGGISFINGRLGDHIESDSSPIKNNSKVREVKSFDGNLTLFCDNPIQYKKRFPKNECCAGENLIDWQGTTICQKCGHIE